MSQFLKPFPAGGLAALPIYDWPEPGFIMNKLWTAIAVQLRVAGVQAPDGLSRELAYDAAWMRSDLVVACLADATVAARAARELRAGAGG